MLAASEVTIFNIKVLKAAATKPSHGVARLLPSGLSWVSGCRGGVGRKTRLRALALLSGSRLQGTLALGLHQAGGSVF